MSAARVSAEKKAKLPSLRRFLTIEIAIHGAPLILGELGLAAGGYAGAGLWLLGQGTALPWRGHDALAPGCGGFFLGVALNDLALLLYGLLIVARRRRRGKAPLALPERRQALLPLALFSLLPLAVPLLICYEEAPSMALCATRLIGREDKGTTLQNLSGLEASGVADGQGQALTGADYQSGSLWY
ncbi:hypothetical protein [Thermogemmatispora sp.]|uniref:hypothetical protein n=1 Tax=Thermogemmatispora sp. TaxID=1968838 RepID=UPI001DE7884D|nr:hypothetical protein [Thermogemmatispora sp.]MBX5451209.1 hypothetical protein [Thermogemmatispora sp.]